MFCRRDCHAAGKATLWQGIEAKLVFRVTQLALKGYFVAGDWGKAGIPCYTVGSHHNTGGKTGSLVLIEDCRNAAKDVAGELGLCLKDLAHIWYPVFVFVACGCTAAPGTMRPCA